MTTTPRYLIDTLHMITARRAPSAKALGKVGSLHVKRVRDVFEDRNIVGIGISEKWSQKKPIGALSLCFYVERKVAKSKLKLHRHIPPVVASPEGRAVFTDVKAIGRIRPEQVCKETPTNSQESPIRSGFSVAHVRAGAGTIGAIVRKAGRHFILSNSHVLALSGTARKGDGVVYPGPRDGGTAPRNLVAKLAEFIPFERGSGFENTVDAALAEVVAERLEDLDLTLFGVRGNLEIIAPERGMTVIKSGRTTGEEREGIVEDVDCSMRIPYPGMGLIGFRGLVLCSRYTCGGDSGALVVDKKSGKIAGLHFSGSADGKSIFTPMATVVSELGFEFATR